MILIPTTAPKKSILALGFAFLVLGTSFGFALQSFTTAYSIPARQAAINDIKASNSGGKPEVIGVTNSNSACSDAEDYLKKIALFTPEVKVRFGTEQKSIAANQLLSCRTAVNSTSTNAEGCMEYALVIDDNCVENLLTTTYKFVEPAESVQSVATGRIVEARISDSVINYPVLADMVTDAFQKNSVYSVMTSRYALIRAPQLTAPLIKNAPNTDGNVASRYIEFDGSRQLMFLWTNGEYEMFKISGAFPEYNPVGVFAILNKAPLAWSSTANKWMPYWQAFTYDKRQNAMLGIHALVYWYPDFQKTGTRKIFETEAHIGVPRSTGCLRLTTADAKKVFEWSKIGDVVVVHD